jgi:hypothetical protein
LDREQPPLRFHNRLPLIISGRTTGLLTLLGRRLGLAAPIELRLGVFALRPMLLDHLLDDHIGDQVQPHLHGWRDSLLERLCRVCPFAGLMILFRSGRLRHGHPPSCSSL